ncbi:MAG: NUDIX domain-containing protein [Pyramidobacter sp.]|nr:NUDIX domain-containing protein [Pyramidobacter sp.]
MNGTDEPTQEFCQSVADRLSEWYERSHRDFPWRHDRDPYRIFVSETMLQQTQAERVRSFFVRWLDRFPTLASLAAASEEDVLQMWQGLGYYSRARSILASAQMLISKGYSTLPADAALLEELPGFGPYTAGAVCSIAFDMPTPAVDANVRRVFSRLLDLSLDPSKAEGRRIIENAVRTVLLCGTPHILTQAFMELGATVCLPSCRCVDCPLDQLCRARAAGTQQSRPAGGRIVRVKRRNGAALLFRTPAGICLRRRAARGLWADFYEIPWVIGDENETHDDCLRRLASELGVKTSECGGCGMAETLRFTQWQVRVRLWTCRHFCAIPQNLELFPENSLEELPMPAGIKRLVIKYLKS